MNSIKPFTKQSLSYKHGKINLNFNVSQELFSSAVIDHGTQRLLRTLLFKKVDSYHKALDMGCGYGPIGIALKATCPTAEVHMTDSDALALEFSKENARLNGFNDLNIYGSLAYDAISDSDFDLIVSNIPAKVGEPILRNMILDAQDHLVEGGKVVIVVIDSIADFIRQELTQNENIHITFYRSWPGHHVYHYKFKSKRETAHKHTFNSGDFYRQKNSIKIEKHLLELDVSHNLPEFDHLSYGTSLLLSYIENINIQPNAQIINLTPGQGYIPLAIAKKLQKGLLFIPDRDLLALDTTRHNLEKYNFKHVYSHQVGYSGSGNMYDAAIGLFPEKQHPEVYEMYLAQIIEQLKPHATLIISSRSRVISLVESILSKDKSLQVIRSEKANGYSVIDIQKK